MKTVVKYCILLCSFNTISAQLSPGDLSRVHKNLEGVSNCTKCHEIGEKVQPQKCLDCHKILNERIKAGKGIHADAGYEDCADCHSDHHGRDYKLIYWENGQEKFAHKETGFELLGKHSQLNCNDCHSSKNIRDKQKLQSQKKDLNKTFLGLSQDCLSCHRDEHRGQMDTNCLNCHNMNGWKPAPEFNHNKTKFRLTGLHKKVECKNCHKTVTDNKYEDDKTFLKFAGLEYDQCIDCHKDPHNNKFGQNCESCHNTSGWQNYAKNNFDHNKTRYPLKGKHKNVSCESCHGRGRSKKIKAFNKCTDCHKDFHVGQFIGRNQKGACEECHTVEGFSPAQFTINDHSKSDYPLQGAHLAIPCIACHTDTWKKQQKTLQFTFSSTKCTTCHKDPHKKQVDKYVIKINSETNKSGCEYCHLTESWQSVQFDHSQTQFLLEGIHAKTECSKCHKKDEKVFIKFQSTDKECVSCHKDVHNGQFKNKAGVTHCDKCHGPVDWYAEKFNHESFSKFSLKGAHSRVPCQKCHKEEKVLGTTIVRYKPLSSDCKSCHSDLEKRGKI